MCSISTDSYTVRLTLLGKAIKVPKQYERVQIMGSTFVQIKVIRIRTLKYRFDSIPIIVSAQQVFIVHLQLRHRLALLGNRLIYLCHGPCNYFNGK